MTFKTKQLNIQTLGEYLKECREHLEYSVTEVSKLSQVQPKYIQALEKEDYDFLPPSVYVKGFLRSLAKVYHVDERYLLEEYEAERNIQNNIIDRDEVVREGISSHSVLPRFVLSPKTLTISGIAILGLLSFGYLYFQVSSLSAAPLLELESPDRDITVNSSMLLLQGKTESGANVFLNDQPIMVDAKGEFLENISLAPGSNHLVIRAENKFDRKTVISRNIVYQERSVAGSFDRNTDTADSGKIPAVVDEKLVLEIAVNNTPAWIFIEADGTEIYSGTMLSGSSRKIEAAERIVLTTGNAGATSLVFNGEDLGALGEEGEVLRDVEFTK